MDDVLLYLKLIAPNQFLSAIFLENLKYLPGPVVLCLNQEGCANVETF